MKSRIAFEGLFDDREKFLFWACYGSMATVMALTAYFPIPTLIQMMMYTLPIIFIGSHMSLRQKETNPETGERLLKVDSLNNRDAMMFPVLGSVALVTLYLAYKYLPASLVNVIVSGYLTFFGVAALGETLRDILIRLPTTKSFDFPICNFVIPIPSRLETLTGPVELKLTTFHFVAYSISLLVAIGWAISNQWLLHNLLACAFSIQGISLISVGSFQVASILLSGLFIYDIFWVFATEVMVSVAKSFRAPAKLIFPVSHNPWKQSILGLGDIVVPGIFIAMVLRYDWNRHQQSLTEKRTSSNDESPEVCVHEFSIFNKFPKGYFILNMLAYAVALVITVGVLHITGHAQPALLYLVPFCLGALFIPALWYNDFTNMWSYSEESQDEDVEDSSEELDRSPKPQLNVPDDGTDDEEETAVTENVSGPATVDNSPLHVTEQYYDGDTKKTK